MKLDLIFLEGCSSGVCPSGMIQELDGLIGEAIRK